jgi:predicted amidohydrolase
MKVAAYQASLKARSNREVIDLLRKQVDHCESIGVEILCCPEAVLGGLADYSTAPTATAIDVERSQLSDALAPLRSDTVTTIVGFTEIDRSGRLYNSAAVFHRGSVIGVYRKHHPSMNRSVYAAGDATPVFTVGALTFGIIICRDSNFAEPARTMVGKGARAFFVPTNNGMPPLKGGPELIMEARNADIVRARTYQVSVIRADVAGRAGGLMSYGSSGIVDQGGIVLGSAKPLVPDLVVADIEVAPPLRP